MIAAKNQNQHKMTQESPKKGERVKERRSTSSASVLWTDTLAPPFDVTPPPFVVTTIHLTFFDRIDPIVLLTKPRMNPLCYENTNLHFETTSELMCLHALFFFKFVATTLRLDCNTRICSESTSQHQKFKDNISCGN